MELWLLCGELLLFGPVAALTIVWLLGRRLWWPAAAIVLALALWGVGYTLYLVYGVGFFGRALACLSIPVAGLGLVVFLATRRSFYRKTGDDRQLQRIFMGAMVLVPLLQLFPLPGMYGLNAACNSLNRGLGDEIVSALQQHRLDHGDYPQDLSNLTPAYLPILPRPRCFGPYAWFDNPNDAQTVFALQTCRDPATTLLTVPQITTEFIQRYNLQTGQWSSISFLDGVCSFLAGN